MPVRLEPGVVPASRAATSRATDVVGTALDGTPARVEVTGEGRRTLLAFLSSGCSVCRDFWDELSSGEADVPGQARLAVVTQGPQEESVTRLRQLAGPRLEVVAVARGLERLRRARLPLLRVRRGRRRHRRGLLDHLGAGARPDGAGRRRHRAPAPPRAAPARRRRRRRRPAGSATGTTRDDPARIDRELLGAGIHPGHPSLYEPPEAAGPGPGGVAAVAADAERSRMSPAAVALALGLPMAVVAAVRSTWSP